LLAAQHVLIALMFMTRHMLNLILDPRIDKCFAQFQQKEKVEQAGAEMIDAWKLHCSKADPNC